MESLMDEIDPTEWQFTGIIKVFKLRNFLMLLGKLIILIVKQTADTEVLVFMFEYRDFKFLWGYVSIIIYLNLTFKVQV